jgi:hypothetical protein
MQILRSIPSERRRRASRKNGALGPLVRWGRVDQQAAFR